MLANIVKTSLRACARYQRRLVLPAQSIVFTSKRHYYEDNVLMKRVEGEYFADPKAVAERVVRIIGLHDNVFARHLMAIQITIMII